MGKIFPHIILVVCLVISSIVTYGQTRVAMPSTVTVEFSDLKVPEMKRLQTKRLEKIKSRKIRKLEKLVKHNTDIQRGELESYRVIFQGMDSVELEDLYRDLTSLESGLELPAYDDTQLGQYSRYGEVSIEKDSIVDLGKDELQRRSKVDEYTSQYGDLNQLDSAFLDSLRTIRLDSIQLNLNEYIDPSWESRFDSLKQTEVNNQVSIDSLIGSQIENRLTELVHEKIEAGDLAGLNKQYTQPQSLVAQYIPSLEKFDYQKPEIPKEKLDSALIEQVKQRKLDELKSGFQLNEAESYQQQSVLSRFAIGGYMRYDAFKNSIELTPSLTYAITQNLIVGGGYQTNISLDGSDSLNTKGIRAFGDYVFYDTYFLHLETEWIGSSARGEDIAPTRERNIYAGIGRSFQYRFVRSSVTALYNFSAPTQLRPKRFTIRLGFTISK